MSMSQDNGKPQKCDMPMKMRRRQSDAKWRANVASCYETLKHIIPVNKRSSRRQISKAHIIQQTSNHIQFLEEVMSSLLIEKAKKDGAKNPDRWKSEKLEEIKEDFVNQHRKKLEHLNAEKRYKKKSYKLFMADEYLQENIQQTAQLREALFESRKEITSCNEFLDKGVICTKSEINGVDVYTYNGVEESEYGVTTEAVQSPIHYSICDITTQGDHEHPDYSDVTEKPIDHSLNGTSEALDLTFQKTGVTLESVHTVRHAAISQFGGSMFVTSTDNLTDTTSIQIVPELMFTEKITSQENQAEGKTQNGLDCTNDLQLVPDLSNSEQLRMSVKPSVQNDAVKYCLNDQSGKTPVKRVREADSTPRKIQKTSESTGFTPVKLPSSWTDGNSGSFSDSNPVAYITPIKTTNGYDNVSNTGNLQKTNVEADVEALMCTEEMWMSSDDETEGIDQRLQHTPNHSDRRTDLRNLKRARHERTLRQRLTSTSSLSSDSCVKESKQNHTDDQEVPKKKALSNIKCRRSLQGSSLTVVRGLWDSGGLRLYSLELFTLKEVYVTFLPTPTSLVTNSAYSYTGFYDSDTKSFSPRSRWTPSSTSLASQTGDSESETLDFDGYLLFYKKMGAELHQNIKHQTKNVVDEKMSRLIYESWTKLPHGQKNFLKQLALSEQNSQDSGFCKSPKNMKELEELDNEIWPLPQDIDLNATDQPNIFSPDPLVSGVDHLWGGNALLLPSECHASAAEGNGCHEMKTGCVLTNGRGATSVATLCPVKLEQPSWANSTTVAANCSTKETHTEDIQPVFVLDNKDLFLGEFLYSPSASVDEEVQKYFQDFSPPLASKLPGLE